jgi:hypothetical protein
MLPCLALTKKSDCSISDMILKLNLASPSGLVEIPRLQGEGNSAKRGVKNFEV